MKNIGYILAVIALIGGMVWYYFSDSEVKKREIRASLAGLSQAVASKDRKQVSATLAKLLTDDAKVHLTIEFLSIGNLRPAMDEDFDKVKFIAFIDNLLYSLTDYRYTPTLKKLDAKSGKAAFSSVGWADGSGITAGISLDMRYSSETSCEAAVIFEDKTAKLKTADCILQLIQIPRPGQEGKFLQGLH